MYLRMYCLKQWYQYFYCKHLSSSMGSLMQVVCSLDWWSGTMQWAHQHYICTLLLLMTSVCHLLCWTKIRYPVDYVGRTYLLGLGVRKTKWPPHFVSMYYLSNAYMFPKHGITCIKTLLRFSQNSKVSGPPLGIMDSCQQPMKLASGKVTNLSFMFPNTLKYIIIDSSIHRGKRKREKCVKLDRQGMEGQGRQHRGGKGGERPPNVEVRGAEPPKICSFNLYTYMTVTLE